MARTLAGYLVMLLLAGCANVFHTSSELDCTARGCRWSDGKCICKGLGSMGNNPAVPGPINAVPE
jgi:hypothetical protein